MPTDDLRGTIAQDQDYELNEFPVKHFCEKSIITQWTCLIDWLN